MQAYFTATPWRSTPPLFLGNLALGVTVRFHAEADAVPHPGWAIARYRETHPRQQSQRD
jgi:hypothetical protein